jgi:predicted ATPase
VAIYQSLLPAIQKNLIVPTSSMGLVTTEKSPIPDLTSALVIPTFKFIHDQVQQTAIHRLSERQAQEINLHIGRWLGQQNNAVDISKVHQVDYLNQGQPLITDANEKQRLAELNLTAGRRAMTTTAYVSASAYFSMGLKNLPSRAWQEQPQLTFDLTYGLAEAEQRQGKFEASEALIKKMLAQLESPLDQAQVNHLLISIAHIHKRCQHQQLSYIS